MKKFSFIFLIVVLLVVAFPRPAQAAYTARLVAGQNQIIGWVHVDNDANNLYITFETRFGLGFCLNETQVHVADSLSGIPQTNSGNPKIGHFDYKGSHACIRDVTYTIPLGSWTPGTPLFIAAHAVIGSWWDTEFDETAWGVKCGDITNYPFPGGSWANYFLYTLK